MLSFVKNPNVLVTHILCSPQMASRCPAIYQKMRSFSWGRGIISLISTDWWEKRIGQCISSVSTIKENWITDRFINSHFKTICQKNIWKWRSNGFCIILTLCILLCGFRNNWTNYHPHTNVLWLHYLCSKLLSMKYRSAQGKAVKEALTQFNKNVLQYGSATEVLQTCPMFKQ